MKSAMPHESCATAFHSTLMAAGGLSAISRHSAARSTTSTTSRISVVSSAAPAIRDFSTSLVTSSKPEKSKRPAHAAELADFPSELLLILDPFAVSRRCEVAISPCPRGEEAYPLQQVAQGVELQHAGAGVGEGLRRHQSSMLQDAAGGSARIVT